MHLTHFEEEIKTDDKGLERRNLEVFTHGNEFFLRISPPDNPGDFEFQFFLDQKTFMRFYDGIKAAGEYMAWLKT